MYPCCYHIIFSLSPYTHPLIHSPTPIQSAISCQSICTPNPSLEIASRNKYIPLSLTLVDCPLQWSVKDTLSLDIGEDFEGLVPENFTDETAGELGSAFTIQTVTRTEVELPLPYNVTEEEARGSIATLGPIDITPTASELYEGFTVTPGLFATGITAETAFTEAENVTEEEATPVWAIPEEVTTWALETFYTSEAPEVSSVEEALGVTATPELESASAFTVEEQIVQVTAAPDIALIPEQPISPTGKSQG